MKLGRDTDRAGPNPGPAVPPVGKSDRVIAAEIEARVACLQEAIKRHGPNDMRPVLVIAKEYETWCLTGDNAAASRAAAEAQAAVAAAPKGERD